MKYFLIITLLVAGCEKKAKVNQLELQTNIQKISMQLQSQKELDEVLANNFEDSVKVYAGAFPKDTMTPKFLFTSAQVLRALHKSEKAIQTFELISKEYHDFALAPEAKFLAAFTSEVDSKNMEMAIQKYQSFIAMFPDHQLATQAKISLESIQKATK